MNIRKLAFDSLELLKGQPVTKEIKRLERAEADRTFYSKEKEAALYRFMQSLRDVPYYSDLDLSKGLEQFPIMQKATIQANQDQFLSTKYQKDQLVKVSTSGSYGLPAEYYLTKQKKAAQHAEVIHYGRKVGYDVGVNHMYIRSVVHKSKLKQFMQNEYYLGCKDLDEDFLREARLILKDKGVKVIIGFPTAITMLAEYCATKGDSPQDFALRGVITSSENLTAHQRSTMANAWGGGVGICSRYSTEEFGVLACQYEEEGDFYVNSLNYQMEILRVNSDEPCGEGEIGRIIVTDLYSLADPLVRYDTGDLGLVERVERDGFGGVIAFRSLSGRGVQVIVTPSGELKYPLYFDSIMEDFQEMVSQYQLIQETDCRYRVLVIPKIDLAPTVLDNLRRAITKWLGDGAEISVEVVDDLEALPSGKRPYVINKTLR